LAIVQGPLARLRGAGFGTGRAVVGGFLAPFLFFLRLELPARFLLGLDRKSVV